MVVVCLCKDRPEVVQRFVTRQRALGAAELRIYFDDPADPSLDWAAAQPGVIATACDDAFWARARWKGEPARPEHVEGRQAAAYRDAYAQVPGDRWVGFCDSDELFVPHEDFATLLARVPPGVGQLIARVAEAIWPPGASGEALQSATLARRPVLDEHALERVLRHRAALFALFSKRGLMGHVHGKAIIRGGLPDVAPRIHAHYHRQPDGSLKRIPGPDGAVTLLHYDALSYADWCAKHLRRLQRETVMGGNRIGRSAQSELFGLCTDEAGRRALFAEFYGSSDGLIAALARAGSLVRLDDSAVPGGEAPATDAVRR